MMNTLRFPLLVPVFAIACSSPSAPTPAVVPSPVATTRASSLVMSIVPDSDPVTGFRSPMTLSIRATAGSSPAVIQNAVFQMLDDQGKVIAQAAIAVGDPLPPDGYLSGDLVVQTLSWPPQSGQGRRIGGSLTYRAASGEVLTLPLAIPAR
jgi:hypothetical protein